MSRLEATLQAIDELHKQDPKTVDGKAEELTYAEHCSRWLDRLAPDASEELQIAVRSQHLCRWEIPRKDYPMDRTGYLKWRTALGKLHADKAIAVMQAQGYEQESCERTATIIRKLGIKRDAEVQTLEDCACLVFLETGFLAFAEKHSEEKIISIVQKTWAKMSETAQQEALKLPFPDQALALLNKALN
ncbi:DUF4202 domain-containing protein [Parendozoicomonas haliclonae]|uniref:DUF4202 domain-containing protein n=1 Tax=Parendozoicomonas haliclonae TaxID=1960125 RepID=A0A1X7AFK0_9GAMM|nr:DUF4202 domain-containing protein [Parendozoicomonas haliclonae]SMA37800.1 hypothetical protein EHSB41UT_00792 [Parendozoicomonas haliclonae]